MHFRYSLARTPSISRIFQMATRSLCIASKHFFRLMLRKYIPYPISLQYSVTRSEDIEKKPRGQFTLFPYSMIIIRHQAYSISDRYLLYWCVDLTRGINALRRCKSNLCCIQKVFNWSCQLVIGRATCNDITYRVRTYSILYARLLFGRVLSMFRAEILDGEVNNTSQAETWTHLRQWCTVSDPRCSS